MHASAPADRRVCARAPARKGTRVCHPHSSAGRTGFPQDRVIGLSHSDCWIVRLFFTAGGSSIIKDPRFFLWRGGFLLRALGEGEYPAVLVENGGPRPGFSMFSPLCSLPAYSGLNLELLEGGDEETLGPSAWDGRRLRRGRRRSWIRRLPYERIRARSYCARVVAASFEFPGPNGPGRKFPLRWCAGAR